MDINTYILLLSHYAAESKKKVISKEPDFGWIKLLHDQWLIHKDD